MTKYIAFLRGINVGNIRIKMPDLKACFEKLGFSAVVTYLQTGNVVFKSDKNSADIKAVLEAGLTEAFHYEAFVLVYEHAILQDIIANYPKQREEEFHAYVLFVEREQVFEDLLQQAQILGDSADYIKGGKHQVIYWKVKTGDTLSGSFDKIIAKPKYKSTTTMRNIQTLEKMV